MEPPASQASSHFSLEPIPASVLADREVNRRDATVALGLCRTGCAELDEYVLLGGLERGSVVGLSAEDEEVGVQLGLQTLAHALCGGESVASGLVITPKPASAILGVLRDAVRAELKENGATDRDVATKTKLCLERVMLSCVFDLDGLWEVLADLDRTAASGRSEANQDEAVEPGEEAEEKGDEVDEIADSQDEDDELLSSPDAEPQQQPPPEPLPPKLPDIIIITHFSSLLTGLFSHREKSAAHNALQLLSAHIRYLSRNLSTHPLIMFLNSTSSSSVTTTTTTTTAMATAPLDHALLPGPKKQSLDSTLRSIFNPPPPPDFAPQAPRRNKPSFGLVFSQLLDLHLLCTRLPRNRVEAEAVTAVPHHQADGAGVVRTVWVVEVLLDQMGVWEGRKGPRRDREQRWAAFNVERGRVKGVHMKI